jgi:hypothetical protein
MSDKQVERSATQSALPAAEAFADAAQRPRARGQRPEEDGHLPYQTVVAQLQMVAELQPQTVDAGVSDEHHDAVAVQLVGVREVVEHADEDSDQGIDLPATLECQPVSEG